MASVNEVLRDEAIAHQVGLQRYSTGVVRRIMALLNRTDADLMAALSAALDRLPAESFTVERLESLLHSVRSLNAEAYRRVGADLHSEMRELAEYEAGYQRRMFEAAVPAQALAAVRWDRVDLGLAHAAAMSQPFGGRLLREWGPRLAENRAFRIRESVRLGFNEGQSIQEIVRRVRGTRAKGRSDGVIEVDRRHAESLVRTAVSHTAGYVRDKFYKEHGDLIKAVVWVSTLDSKTSHDCRLRDGKQYTPKTHRPIGHGLPWLGGPGRAHWRCRSTSVPVTKSWRELGIDIDDMPAGTRASMDGQVAADLTYGQWLKGQSASRQDEVLGPARGKLFRQGGLDIEKFADDRGRWKTLDQLREADAKSFERAGL